MTTCTLERCFTQADFDRFARLSGDTNPIHVDPAFSARTRFGRTVAHGVLLITVLRGLVAQLAPGSAIAEQAIRFVAPTFADEPMRFTATRNGLNVTVRVERLADDTLTCDGTFTLAGASASVTRAFSAADVADYVALGGAAPPAGTVPEPLVGALFSQLLGMTLPGQGTNYLKQEIVTEGSGAVDEPLTARVTITRLRPDKHLVDLDTRCHGADGRLLAHGRSLVYIADLAAPLPGL